MNFKGFSVGIQNDSEKIKQLVLQSKQIADDLASLQAQIQELSTSKTSGSGGLPVDGNDSASYLLDLANCTSLYPLVVDKNKRKIQSIESVPEATHATSADTATSADDSDMLDGYHAGNSSGNVPVSNGTVNTDLNADKLDGYHAGNSSGNVPVSNGTVNTNLNADMLDGISSAGFVQTPTIIGSEQTIINAVTTNEMTTTDHDILLGATDNATANTTTGGRYYAVKITMTRYSHGVSAATATWRLSTVASDTDPLLASLGNTVLNQTKVLELILPHGRYKLRTKTSFSNTATTTVKAKEINTGILYNNL